MVAAKVICIYINRPWERVAAFLADPLTMNHWASGLGRSLRHDHGRWRAKGPAGSVFIRFSPPNAFGVADHWVDMADGVEVYVPLRVMAHGQGCDVQLTLQRPSGMSDEQYATDVDWVGRDLAMLKALLETSAGAAEKKLSQ